VSDESLAVLPDAVFPDRIFTDARERLGLSVDHVCRQLHLPQDVINAIEKADLQHLSDPVFARGYIRSYARFLRLDPEPLIQAYNQQTGNLSTTGRVKAIGTVSVSPGRGQGHPLLRFGSWLFLLALVAVSIWWWQAQYGFDADERAELDQAPVSVETSDGTTLVLPQLVEPEFDDIADNVAPPVVTADNEATAPVSEPAAIAADSELGVEPEVTQALQVVAEPESEPESASLAQPGTLDLSFSADCWLSVKDASGRTLFSGVAEAGSSLALDGVEPLAIVVGRVSAVARMAYAEKTIDLAAISKNNVARLSLPL